MATLANSTASVIAPHNYLIASILFLIMSLALLGFVLEGYVPRVTPRPGPVQPSPVPPCLVMALHRGRGGCHA